MGRHPFSASRLQHQCCSDAFQCKALCAAQAKAQTVRVAAADAGQIIGQPHCAKGQRPQQCNEQAGGHLPVAAKQRRLCSTCGQPAHAHSGKGAHHQAQPAHGRHRAVRGIAVRLCTACRTLQLPQQRHHHIAERRSQHKTQHRRDDQGETNHFSISKFMPKGYSSASFCSA